MAVKVSGIILIYLLQPDIRFGFKIKNSRLPLFYLIVIGIAIINWIIGGMFLQANYNIVLLTGIGFWILCILAIHQVKLMVEKNDAATIHQTLKLFFILNIIISALTYLNIAWETGTINPFTYQGEFQKYFIGTGDYIKGITLDTSVTNAILCAFGVVYFLDLKNGLMCLLCMITLLLTGSNFTNILLSLVLLYLFIFQSNKDQKSLVVVCLVMMLVFILKISPQNEQYVASWYSKLFNKPVTSQNELPQPTKQKEAITIKDPEKEKIARQYVDSITAAARLKKKPEIIVGMTPQNVSAITGKPEIPQPDINSLAYQHRDSTTIVQKELKDFINKNQSSLSISKNDSSFLLPNPGKLIAMRQTFFYLKKHPQHILTGTGIGNFSSKLAFRSTAMNIAGGYPAKFAYMNDNFKANHFDLYLYFFSRQERLHSIVNSPNSVYDQLLSEYGLIGLISFFIFYIGFFIKNIKQLTYGIPLLLLMSGAFFVDYWFEQLSVVIIFELMLFLNMKETKTKSMHLYNG